MIFGNAIHLVQDKAQVIAGISKVLRLGGTLAFNTTFFDGAYAPDTHGFYKLWVLRAMRCLRQRGYNVARGVKATAMEWLSPEEYRRLLQATGFGETQMELHEKRLSCQAIVSSCACVPRTGRPSSRPTSSVRYGGHGPFECGPRRGERDSRAGA